MENASLTVVFNYYISKDFVVLHEFKITSSESSASM